MNTQPDYVKVLVGGDRLLRKMFYIKKDTQMGRLREFVCRKVGLARSEIRLMINGRRVEDDEVPLAIGM